MAACISSGLLLFRLRFKHFRLKEHFRYLKGVSRLGTQNLVNLGLRLLPAP